MKRLLFLAILWWCCSGCLTSLAADSGTDHPTTPFETLVIDEATEQAFLAANGGRAKLLTLHQPPGAESTTVTIHGMKAAPDSVQLLSERAARRGHRVMTLIYDDQGRRLRESAKELAAELMAVAEGGKHLRIEAHSMGARLAIAAMWRLDRRAERLGRVQLVLIAPPLSGSTPADGAPYTPVALDRIPGIRPSIDMGARSTLQRTLEDVLLPGNVSTQIYLADDDEIVDPDNPRFKLVADRLEARIEWIERSNHADIVRRLASRPAG